MQKPTPEAVVKSHVEARKTMAEDLKAYAEQQREAEKNARELRAKQKGKAKNGGPG